MRHMTLKDGTIVPRLGLGTWHMGEKGGSRAAEVKAICAGVDLGLTLVDTAEMYGEGGAEEMLGEALAGRRDQVFLVSKVYPHNASRTGVIAACERSLKRLGTDHLDLYLLHWRGSHPLADTVAAFEQLTADGKISRWGVSNFDVDDMQELRGLKAGTNVSANQVLYHLGSRGIEFDLIADCAREGEMVMAYSPLGQGSVLRNPVLGQIARDRGVSPAAIALAWTLRHDNVVAIPKATNLDHVKENAAAADLVLDERERAALDKAFPPPRRKTSLGML